MFNILQLATRDDTHTLPHHKVQFSDDNKRVDYANAAGRRGPQNSVPTGRDPSPCLQRSSPSKSLVCILLFKTLPDSFGVRLTEENVSLYAEASY
jgi:hypothetical protein